jgi:cell division protein YceG involved in septum cleavage
MTRIVRGCLIFAVLAGIGFGSRVAFELYQRPQGNPGSVELHVPRGISGRELVRRLEVLGLAEQPDLVYWTLRGAGVFETMQAGTYLLPGTATPLDW